VTNERLLELWKQANENLDKAPWYTFARLVEAEARR
jgi:hypothetical protein